MTGDAVDDTIIFTRLAGVDVGDSRALDHLCEDVAQSLIDAGREPAFIVETADFQADPLLIAADRYWYRRFHADPTIGTATQCARWLHDHVAAEHRDEVELKWALGYGFVTRGSVESAHEIGLAAAAILEARMPGPSRADVAFYHAGKLRGGLRFEELHRFLDSSLLAMTMGTRREEPVVIALRGFAAFGYQAITPEHAKDLLHQAWTHPDRSHAVIDICLNGLDCAARFDDQYELLTRYAAEAVALHPRDSVVHHRLAIGRSTTATDDAGHCAALAAIDRALELLPRAGARGSWQLFEAQYMQRRAAIQDTWNRARWASEQQQRWERNESRTEAIQSSLQNATVRAVELVAVFTAAIAFAVGSLQISLGGTLDLGARATLIATLGGGLIAFAITIIGGTWYLTRPRSRSGCDACNSVATGRAHGRLRARAGRAGLE